MDRQMRDVSLSDMGQVLSWRNSETCVRYSKSNSAVSSSQHKIWFEDRILKNSKEPYFIFTKNNQDIGSVRFDLVQQNSKVFLTSIIINPEFYGLGFGSKVLSLAISQMIQNFPKLDLTAEIHDENKASIKIFKRNHFKLINNDGKFGLYRLTTNDFLLQSKGN
jgi:RimJ/RimL family protein N-acetyltransferase